jgi:hypothetical protein
LFAAPVWSGSLALVGHVPFKCVEIERVLVDARNSACTDALGSEYEVFRFIVGPQARTHQRVVHKDIVDVSCGHVAAKRSNENDCGCIRRTGSHASGSMVEG